MENETENGTGRLTIVFVIFFKQRCQGNNMKIKLLSVMKRIQVNFINASNRRKEFIKTLPNRCKGVVILILFSRPFLIRFNFFLCNEKPINRLNFLVHFLQKLRKSSQKSSVLMSISPSHQVSITTVRLRFGLIQTDLTFDLMSF